MQANTLKIILPSIISPSKSDFILGMIITDNILLAYEVVHTIKRRRGKRGVMLIKLDISKAWDQVNWRFF